jgi:PAS domain S-box-containing protein
MAKMPVETGADLRRRAIETLDPDAASLLSDVPFSDLRQLHELELHQIELELQNEELRQAQRDLELRNHELLRSQKMQSHYFDLFDLAPAGYLTVGANGLILEANLAAAAMLGLRKPALLQKALVGFFLPDDLELFTLHRNRVVESALFSWEMRMQPAKGAPFWAQLQTIPAHAGNYLVTFSDISERKRAETALNENQQLFHSTINGLSAHICVIDAQGSIVITNCAWESFGAANDLHEGSCGIGSNYFAACDCFGVGGPAVKATISGIRSVLVGTGLEYVTEYPCHSPDEERWFCCRVNPINISGARYAVIAHEDITKRKQTELLLQKNQDLLTAVIDGTSDAIFAKDVEGRYILFNNAAARMSGKSIGEILGNDDHALLPDDEARAAREVDREIRASGEARTIERTHVSATGEKIFSRGVKKPLRDARGAIIGVFCMAHDITEARRAEDEILELNRSLEMRITQAVDELRLKDQMLVRQDRQAALGEMINNIAHQWRQPLATLGMIVQRAHAVGTREVLTADYLNEFKVSAMRQVRYMSDTIDEFRDFYQRGKEKVPFSPLSCINDAVKLFRPQLTSSVISVQISSGDYGQQRVDGFSNEFKQVILNLLGNARDAILERRKNGDEPEEGRIAVQLSLGEGGSVSIDFSDNGCGIPPGNAAQLFVPYFTTKEATGGTGIGLYMSRMIIEKALGGSIDPVAVAEGATFRIKLPLEKLA